MSSRADFVLSYQPLRTIFCFLRNVNKNSHSKKRYNNYLPPMSKTAAASTRKRKPGVPSVESAPTFDTARVELFKSLSQWVFARVLHPCTVPTEATQKQEGYFHGIAIAEDGDNGRQRIWFKKHVSRRQSVFIGPVKVEAAVDACIPEPGDVLMGKLAPSTANPKDGKKAQSPKFVVWYPMTNHLLTLLTIVRNGTTTSESALCNELRPPRPSVSFGCKKKRVVPKGDDDTWALARLILFGNINVFAEEHQNADQGPRMNLSYPPLEFVYRCSSFFGDATIWSRFKEVVPGAEEPVDSESSCLSNDDDDGDEDDGCTKKQATRRQATSSHKQQQQQQTMQPRTDPWSSYGKPVGYNTDLYVRYNTDAALPEAYDPCDSGGINPPLPRTPPPACPVSPVYSPVTPPVSPPYCPLTPPVSPPYCPLTPQVSPPYCPLTPPVSPPYCPVTPPVSPPYCPPASPPASHNVARDYSDHYESYFAPDGPPILTPSAVSSTVMPPRMPPSTMMTIQDLQKIMAEVSSIQKQSCT